MKRIIWLGIIGAALILAVEGITTVALKNVNRGECAYCPTYKCFGPYSCGYGCQCVTLGGEVGGTCASVE